MLKKEEKKKSSIPTSNEKLHFGLILGREVQQYTWYKIPGNVKLWLIATYLMVDVAFFSASSLISTDTLSTAAGNDSFNKITLV